MYDTSLTQEREVIIGHTFRQDRDHVIALDVVRFPRQPPAWIEVVRYMVRGALLVWLPWFLGTAIAARLLLPTLVVVLCITSTSPVTDLALVVGASVLAAVVAALAGLAIGVLNQRRGQVAGAPLYLAVIGLVPYLTIFALIARTEHGLIVAPAVVVGLVSYSFIARFFRRAMLPRRVLNSR